jgi:hypothetical protein
LLLLEFPGASSSVSRRPLGGGGAGGLVGLPPGDGRRPGRQLEGGPPPACWEYLIARRQGVLGRRLSGTSEAPGKADGQRGKSGRPELLGRPAASGRSSWEGQTSPPPPAQEHAGRSEQSSGREHASEFAGAPQSILSCKSGVCLLRLRLFLCFAGARRAARWSTRGDEVEEKKEKE